MEEKLVDKITAGDTFGRTIQPFLVDGKPNELRIVAIHDCTGLTFFGGVAVFSNLTAGE